MDSHAFRLVRPDEDEPIPFPVEQARHRTLSPHERRTLRMAGLPASADDVLDALDTMSRRIDDLARELDVLGYYDPDDDGPRAA